MSEQDPKQILSREAMDRCRRNEQEYAGRVASRFLAERELRVARAGHREFRPMRITPAGTRLVLAVAALALIAISLAVTQSLFLGGVADPAARNAGAVARVSPSASAFEARIVAASTGAVIELGPGNIHTAVTLRKPVRLVAIDGIVRIGDNAPGAGGD